MTSLNIRPIHMRPKDKVNNNQIEGFIPDMETSLKWDPQYYAKLGIKSYMGQNLLPVETHPRPAEAIPKMVLNWSKIIIYCIRYGLVPKFSFTFIDSYIVSSSAKCSSDLLFVFPSVYPFFCSANPISIEYVYIYYFQSWGRGEVKGRK